MPRETKQFGSDLHLLRNLDRQNERDRGRDLATIERVEPTRDLNRYQGVDNLKQALLLRFLTHVGELARLGHPQYGSRLHELIGRPNNDTSRNLAKLYVLQSLVSEPRVKEIKTVRVTASRRTEITIDISLVAIEENTPLNLVFPFSLEGGVSP